MEAEKLERGNDLKKQIEALKSHKAEIFPSTTKQPYADWNTSETKPGIDVNYRGRHRRDSLALLPALLPFDIETFMHIYEMKLDRKIIELQREFDLL